MPNKLLVTGKNGQLGQSIQKIAADFPQYDITFVGRDVLDFCHSQHVDAFFQANRFDAILHCAAYTAVDKAESEPELAEQINHLAVKQLAEIAKQHDTVLIHISTDYVFNGQNVRPYLECDPTDPQSVYGRTKLNGEHAMQAIAPKGAIIRTSWVYSEFGHNFVKTMLRLGKERDELGVIFDQIGSPTYAPDLAKALLEILPKVAEKPAEIYHFSNEGVCSWYDFAKAIFELAQLSCAVKPIETQDYPTPATRPHFSLMNKTHFKQQFATQIPYWRDSLQRCLTELKK